MTAFSYHCIYVFRFEVLKTVAMEISVFRDVMKCSQIASLEHFRMRK